jgi:hypothetical protein
MKIIYADFNNFIDTTTLDLGCEGSVASIAKIVETLTDGEVVLLTDGERKTTAKIYRRENGIWEARSDNWVFE